MIRPGIEPSSPEPLANTLTILPMSGIIIIIIPNLNQKTRDSDNQQQKNRTCRLVDFAVPADHRVKIKENEKRDKYLDLAGEF